MSTNKEEKAIEDQLEEVLNEVENQEENIKKEQETTEETLSPEEQLQMDLDKEKDKFLRLFAEFENYKRRTSKERIELFKTASQDVTCFRRL